MPESLENQFISDLYTSLLHLSGAELGERGPLNKVFDGAGNSTGLALSGDRVVVNNYIYPRGFTTRAPLEWLDSFYPIGSIQLTLDNNNPTDRIAGTVWERVAEGRFLVGTGILTDKNGTIREFCPGGAEEEAAGNRGGNGDTAGEYLTQLTEQNLPAHNHDVDIGSLDVQIPNGAGTGSSNQSGNVGTIDSTLTFAEQLRARNNLYTKVYANVGEYDSENTINYREASFNNSWDAYPWLYALDIDFNRGSAANYPPFVRALFTSSWAVEYKFKEMIGIWNGETRFVSDAKVRVGTQSSGVSNPARRIQSSDTSSDASYSDTPSDSPQGRTVQQRLFTRDTDDDTTTDATPTSVPSTGAVPITLTKSPYEYAKELGAIDIGEATAGDFLKQNSEVPITAASEDLINRNESANNTRVSEIVGENLAHNNIPPSYGVYVWKRIA